MDVESVHGDTFRACKVNSIAYRAYSLRPGAQPAPDEPVMGGPLRRVEVVLRREVPQVLASLSPSGRELWVYRFQEDDEMGGASANDRETQATAGPRADRTAANAKPDWAPDWAPLVDDLLSNANADCIAQGVFLPPFTGGSASVNRGTSMSMNALPRAGALSKTSLSSLNLAGHSSSPKLSSLHAASGRAALAAFGDRSKYGPLVRAIELKLLDSLLRKGDTEQYEAFGPRAALSTGDGAIVRMQPILQQDGTLDVRITKQLARLVQQPVLSTKLSTSLIWLLPQGKPARILTSLRYEEAVEPANRARARALFYLLNTYFVTNVTLAQLESSLWMRVSSLETGGDLLWPVVLIRASTLISHVHNLAPAPAKSVRSPGHAPPARSHAPGQASPASSQTPSAWSSQPNALLPPAWQSAARTELDTDAAAAFASNKYARSPQRPLVKLLKPSPYTTLANSMISIRRELKISQAIDKEGPSTVVAATDTGNGPELAASILHQAMNRPLAPPPSPRLGTALPSRASTVAPTAAPTVATSPAGVPSASATPAAGVAAHFYPTPSYQTPVPYNASTYGTPSAGTPALVNPDSWMDVERDNEDEVGDADFNFFDLPLNDGEHENAAGAGAELGDGVDLTPKRQSSSPGIAGIRATPETTIVHPSSGGFGGPEFVKSEADEDSSGRSTKRTKFSSLDLHSTELDSKYKDGGRFFVPSVDREDHDDTVVEPAEDTGAEGPNGPASEIKNMLYAKRVVSNDAETRSMDSSSSDDGSDSEMEDQALDIDDSDEVQDAAYFRDSEPPVDHHLSDIEQAWLLSIKHEESSYLPIDSSKFTTFRFLLNQIVFDGGLLSDIYEAPVISGVTIVAPDYVVKRMPWKCTRRPLSPPVSATSQAPRPKLGPGPPTIANQGLQARKVQLLSPPLAAVRRGNYSLRARVSILRFWRLLSLSPPLPENESPELSLAAEKDRVVTLLLVTLDSPAITDAASRTLVGLKYAFEGCRLGKLDLPTFGNVDKGLMRIKADLAHTAGDAVGDLFQTACTQLKSQLQTLTAYGDDSNILVLMCYPPASLRGGTLTAIVPFQLAQGFATIQSTYPSAQWMLSGLEMLISRWGHDQQLSQTELEQLAMRVYSRFPHFPQLFRLASLVPHSLGLQYSLDMPQYLMEDEPVLHVAYLVVEGRWCLASWSDQWARKLELDMFQLNDSSERSLQHVFGEILKRSQTIVRNIKDRKGWRFSISKLDAMTNVELAVWERLFQAGTVIMLMDIPYPRGIVVSEYKLPNTTPPSPTATASPTPKKDGEPDAGTIPSPHAGTPSPSSPFAASAAPPGGGVSAKSDGVIVDARDEIYGISVEAPKPGVGRHAAATALGYLVRTSEEGEVAMETRLLKVHGLNVLPRVIMSRVVGQFRRLASLSEFMGITTESTLLPWHVIALLKLEAATLKLNM